MAIAGLVFLLCMYFLQPTPAQVLAAQDDERSSESSLSLNDIFSQVVEQLNGVVAFTAQAIQAVGQRSDQSEQVVVSPLVDRTNQTLPTPLQTPLRNPGVGTFIINAPLSVTQSFVVSGTSSLATTTVTGPFAAGQINGADLSLTNSLQASTMQLSGLANVGELSVATEAVVNGGIRALGGITTQGADIDLDTGSIFASNVINEVVAGSNVTITGSRNAPIISFEPEPFDGVVSVNGERGRVEFEAGDDIEINGLEIENISDLDSVSSRGGCAGCITDRDVSNVLTLSGGSINGTDIGVSSAASAAFSDVQVGNALSTSSAFTVLNTGTSTFGGSINIESGCFAVNGTCVGGLAASTYLGLDDTPLAFVPGALQFTNASGTALTQSSDLVVVNGNLGIGTSTPSSQLTVDGDSVLSGTLTVVSGTSSQFSGGINITNGCVAVDGTCLGGAAELGDLNDVLLATTTEGDILTYDGTNWINVASSTLGFGDGTFLGLADTPGVYVSNALQFSNASATALTQSADFVFANGNLGIGTSTPTTRLTVEGATSLLGTLSVASASSSQFSGGINITNGCVAVDGTCLGGAAELGDLNDVLLATTTEGDILTYDGTNWINVASSTLGFGDGTFLGLSDTPQTYLAQSVSYVNATGSALTQSANFVYNGSQLAIGTNSPVSTLTVAGDVSVLGGALTRWYDADSSSYVAFRSPSALGGDVEWVLPANDGGSNEILVTDGAGNLRFDSVESVGGGSSSYIGLDDTPLAFVTNAIPFTGTSSLLFSDQFVFDGQNLGIGVDEPLAPLQVQGNTLLQAANEAVGLYYNTNANTVGIGTLNATARLAVEQGSIYQQGGRASSTYTPNQVGSLDLPSNPNANDVHVSGNRAYVVSNSAGDDFHILDIGNAQSPVEMSSLNLPTTANGVFASGDYAYVVSNVSGDDFHIIDVSDPIAPVEVSSLDLPTTASDVFVQGRYAYVVTGNVGNDFHIIDVSDPIAPRIVGETNLTDSGTAVQVKGQYAYVTTLGADEDFHVLDISNPAAPTTTDKILLSDAANDVFVTDMYAYVVSSSGGDDLHIIDISDPTALVELGGLDLITSASAVTVSGRYAYVASAVTGDDLHVIDISDPATPVEVGGVDLAAGAATNLTVSGRYAYITTSNTGNEFHVVDLTGVEAQSGVMHSLQSGSMTVLGDTTLSGRLDVGEGLLVGDAGIYSQGPVYAAGSDASYILGDISIGTTTASSELTVDGVIQATSITSGGTTNLMADAQGNIILEVSDQRLKNNVVTLSGSLDKILALRGVSYGWRDTDRFGDQTEIGFLAQEVDEVVPEVVRKGGSYWSLNTKNLLAVVVEAMKEMWSVVNGNQDRIAELESRISELESSGDKESANQPTSEPEEEVAEDDAQSITTDQSPSNASSSPSNQTQDQDNIAPQPTNATGTAATTTSEVDTTGGVPAEEDTTTSKDAAGTSNESLNPKEGEVEVSELDDSQIEEGDISEEPETDQVEAMSPKTDVQQEEEEDVENVELLADEEKEAVSQISTDSQDLPPQPKELIE